MDINEISPITTGILDLKLNPKNGYSASGKSNGKFIEHMEYYNSRNQTIFTIPYEADKLLDQAAYLISLANHCIENNTNIRY